MELKQNPWCFLIIPIKINAARAKKNISQTLHQTLERVFEIIDKFIPSRTRCIRYVCCISESRI